MKIEVKDLSPIKKTLAVEADPQEVDRETDEVTRGYAQRAKIPGFRPGKAPLAVIRSRFAKEIKDDVRERLVVRLHSEMGTWRNTEDDVAVRDGDVLLIPKKTDYVLVNGQVFNPTAVSYRPGRSARWYLSQAGGMTQLANKKAVFVVRGDP